MPQAFKDLLMDWAGILQTGAVLVICAIVAGFSDTQGLKAVHPDNFAAIAFLFGIWSGYKAAKDNECALRGVRAFFSVSLVVLASICLPPMFGNEQKRVLWFDTVMTYGLWLTSFLASYFLYGAARLLYKSGEALLRR